MRIQKLPRGGGGPHKIPSDKDILAFYKTCLGREEGLVEGKILRRIRDTALHNHPTHVRFRDEIYNRLLHLCHEEIQGCLRKRQYVSAEIEELSEMHRQRYYKCKFCDYYHLTKRKFWKRDAR